MNCRRKLAIPLSQPVCWSHGHNHINQFSALNSIDQYQYRYHAHLHQQEEEAKNAEEGSSRCSDSHLHQVYGQKSHRQVLNTTTVLGLTATTSFINKKMRKTQKKIRHAATVLKFMVQDHWSRLARQLPQPTVLKINGQRPPRRRLQLIKVTTLKSRPMSSPPSSIPAIDKQISSSDRKTSAKINQLQLSSSSITTKVAIMRNFITTKVDKMQKKARHTALTATVVNFLERPRPPRRT